MTDNIGTKKYPFARHETTSADPQESEHWLSLRHESGDKLLETLQDLRLEFQEDLQKNSPESIALWSTVCGYCEALATHKDPLKRFRIFPIPFDALRRLVSSEFLPFCRQLKEELEAKHNNEKAKKNAIEDSSLSRHREAVRLVSNAVWKKAESKSKNVRDELHANSLYVCFRGNIDKRSLDCFGSAVVTLAALYSVLEGSHAYSFLTLSEDHAYESHYLPPTPPHQSEHDNNISDNNNSTMPHVDNIPPSDYGTCEIAIPGNTKDVQQTRGLDVSDALRKASKHRQDAAEVTPETSWLYMRKHPVICRSIPMTIAAVIGNINCSISDMKNGNNNQQHLVHPSQQLSSAPLMDLKRDLLWILHEQGHLTTFPFALLALGECEEHRTTSKGRAWVDVSESMGIAEEVTGMEKLYLDAMAISRTIYGDAQTYPYFCAGQYHKDGIWEEVATVADESSANVDGNNIDTITCRFAPEEEYRLVESVRLYSEASRVASQYRYDLQLMKHMTSAAMLIMTDILKSSDPTQNNNPREWHDECNAVAVGTWLIGFYDSLLFWEESCGGKQFCEILTPKHKFSMGKMFQLLKLDTRRQMLEYVYNKPALTLSSASTSSASCSSSTEKLLGGQEAKKASEVVGVGPVITKGNLLYFSGPRSRRLQKDSPLAMALGKEKLSIGEHELTIPMSMEGGRRAKRARR